jgi:hypothetical protein
MILRLCLNEMVQQSSEHELSLRQCQPDGPGRILVNRRSAANLMSADGPIRPAHLHHPPPHPAPRFPDQADHSTPRFWTVSNALPCGDPMRAQHSIRTPESVAHRIDAECPVALRLRERISPSVGLVKSWFLVENQVVRSPAPWTATPEDIGPHRCCAGSTRSRGQLSPASADCDEHQNLPTHQRGVRPCRTRGRSFSSMVTPTTA